MGKYKRKRHNEVLGELSERLREVEKHLHKRNRHRNTDDEYETRSRRTRSRSQSTYVRSRSPRVRSSRSSTRQGRTPRRRDSSSSISTYRRPISPELNIQTENKGGAEVEVTTGPSAGKTVPTESSEVEQQELPLPASIEVLLGEDGIPAASNPTNLHEGLARRWAAILQSGLSPEIKSTLIKKQTPPSNCSPLIPPKLNEEVAAAMNDSGIKRDKRIGEQQVVLAAAIATIGKVLNQMILTGDEQYVEALSDSSRLLCDLYHENSVTRRSLILPGLNKDMKELMEQTPISEYLFGDKLQDKVNAVKAVKKSGLELKNTPAQSKLPAKLAKNLNYRGPQRPQMLRPSGPKVKPKRPTYPVMKTSTRPRRSPPKQHYHQRRQDHRRH